VKRRKFAVAAAVGFAGLLTMAFTAASIGAADSPGTGLNKAWTKVKLTNHPGKQDKGNPTGKAKFVGSSRFSPTVKVPSLKPGATFAPKVNRAIPTKSASPLAPTQLSAYPTASDLPIHNPALDNPRNTFTLNAYDQFADFVPPVYPNFELTPPDGGMSASPSGQTVEAVNLVFRVYNGNPLSGQNNSESLLNFFYPATLYTGFDFISDPEVVYDAQANRWVMTVLAFGAGAFFPAPPGSALYVAVSNTSDATGLWNIYVINTTFDGSITGCNVGFDFCLGDQPRLATSQYGIQITTNSFSLTSGTFEGSQLYDLDKSAAYSGLPFVNTFYMDLGAISTPDGSCITGACWYSVEPAKWTPGNANLNDPIFGADQYFTSTYDFFGFASDNRQEAWVTAGEQFLNQTGFPNGPFLLFAQYITNHYATPPLGNQPVGNAPAFGCCEPINTNDDRMIYATLANPNAGKNPRVWAGQNTGVNVVDTQDKDLENVPGVAVYDVNFGFPFSGPSVVNQQIIASADAGVAFGSAAITLSSTHGGAIGYSVFGSDAGLYPSSAFSFVNPNRSQLAKSIQVAAAGADPLDEFAVRFGDYSSAVAVGSWLYLESEMVQFPNCSFYPIDPTCGGTRGPNTNWGTSITLVKEHATE
jgi:hypothetical protein